MITLEYELKKLYRKYPVRDEKTMRLKASTKDKKYKVNRIMTYWLCASADNTTARLYKLEISKHRTLNDAEWYTQIFNRVRGYDSLERDRLKQGWKRDYYLSVKESFQKGFLESINVKYDWELEIRKFLGWHYVVD